MSGWTFWFVLIRARGWVGERAGGVGKYRARGGWVRWESTSMAPSNFDIISTFMLRITHSVDGVTGMSMCRRFCFRLVPQCMLGRILSLTQCISHRARHIKIQDSRDTLHWVWLGWEELLKLCWVVGAVISTSPWHQKQTLANSARVSAGACVIFTFASRRGTWHVSTLTSVTRFLQQIRGFIMSAIVFDCLHHCVRTKANGQQNSVDKGWPETW